MGVGALLARRTVLSLAANPLVARAVTKNGMAMGAGRFVAGEKLEEALEAVAHLNARGCVATLDCLGESVSDAGRARQSAEAYLEALEGIARRGLRCNVSVKLTQMGLDIDRNLCLENAGRIAARAAELGNFVRIDMEGSRHTQATMDVFRELREKHGSVGLVIQAYLKRSEADVHALAAVGVNLRLVKGAYDEPASIAYQSPAQVAASFKKLLAVQLLSGAYAAIATHDDALIDFARRFVTEHGIPRSRFEFQMLFGVRRDLQRILAAEGFTMRVYVPFGTDWYAYFMRRLAERPANLAFALKSLMGD